MCLHKGLISSILFLIILVVGIIFVEIKFPREGLQELIVQHTNTSKDESRNCTSHPSLCFSLRAIRSIGIFGFFGNDDCSKNLQLS